MKKESETVNGQSNPCFRKSVLPAGGKGDLVPREQTARSRLGDYCSFLFDINIINVQSSKKVILLILTY